MNRSLLKRGMVQVLAWSGLVALSAVVALAQDSAAGGQRADGQIEMDVVHALDASQQLKNDLITAATIQGEVTLSGTVSSEASRKLAESISGGVSGVTKVHNNLRVGNPQAAQDAQAPAGGEQGDQSAANNQPDYGPAPQPQAYPQQGPGQNQGQDQGQGQYPPPPPPAYGQARPQYAPYPPQQRAYNPPPQPAYVMPKGPVTIPEGTLLQVRTDEPVASKQAKDGEQVQFTVIADVTFGGVLAIPRGATVHGVISDIKKAGALGGSPALALTLTSMDLGGQSYPLETDLFKVKGPNKAGRTVSNAFGGAILGAMIGGMAGGGTGAAIGAGAGAGAGTAASAATPGPGVWIPAEARLDFHLKTPITVNPVTQEEASRLAQELYQGGPTLYRRPGPYGRPYGYAQPYPYPYGYPPVYYRPYYMIGGGFYYWR